jgi:anthranilate phosphoribosyltransferase
MDRAAAPALVAAPMDDAQVADLLGHLPGLPPEDGGAVLAAWTARGETGGELAAVVRWLLARATALPFHGGCLDLCGTGGSGLTRFNISTTVAFVLAAAGVPVVKHGNKGSKAANGSFDLLDALGIPYQLRPESLDRLRRETGICFLFARLMHPVVGSLAPARKAAAAAGARRTVFNLAGPLANPARPSRQVIGVPDAATAAVVAEAVRLLGVERAAVVRGHPGIDEISITGPTHIWECAGGHVRHAIIDRTHQAGLDHEHLPGGEAAANAALFDALIHGRETGPLRSMVIANAAAALDVWHGRPIEAHGPHLERALALLDGGAVATVVERHRALARELAAG